MGDDITIGVTEIVNNIEVTAQPNDQIIDISVVDNTDEVTLNITPTVIEINVNKGSSYAKWGTILGTLSDQEDLQDALDLKADLVDGKVPSSQLPSYVDDVIEVANYAALPATGEIGKIYVTLDNNKIYRWSGSIYIEIAANNAIWGAITGTLSNQTDLNTALNTKALKTTTISTNAPLSGGGDLSANRTLSISQASASVDGYLSATDWNTFNSKLSSLSGAVLTTTDQNIEGNKTFSGYTELNDDGVYSSSFALTIDTIIADAINIKDNGVSKLQIGRDGEILAQKFIKDGGTSSQFLKADGSVDSSTYLTSLSGAVLTTTDQSIDGIKTFTDYTKFTDSSATGGLWAVEIDVNSNDALVVKDGGTVKFQIGRNGEALGQKYKVSGGFSNQFLKANGDLDSTSYQPLLTNPITGTGTTNYVPKFTGTSALGNSLIYDNGTNVFVGGSGSNGNRFTVVEGGTTLVGQQILMQSASSSNDALNIVHSGTGKLIKGTKGVEVFNITNSGGAYFADNVGIGVTPSAWDSLWKVLQLSYGSLYSSIYSNIMAHNLYVAGEDTKYISSNLASQYEQNSGAHWWSTAPTGTAGANVTLTPRMILDNSGKLGIGVTSPTSKLSVYTANGWDNTEPLASIINMDPNTAQGFALLVKGGAGSSSTKIFEVQNDTAGSVLAAMGNGNVGIGTTNATGQSSDNRALQIYGAGFANRAQIHFVNANTGEGTSDGTFIGIDSGKDFYVNNTEGATIFENSGSERMRITSGGNVLVGVSGGNTGLVLRQATSVDRFQIFVGSGGSYIADDNYIKSYNTDLHFLAGSTGTDERMRLTSGGSLVVYNLGTGLLYSNAGALTSSNPSDRRLKDEITDLPYGLNEILKLRPVSYLWKNDTINQGKQFGFIAQEVQEVMPELISEFTTTEDEEEVVRLGLDKEGIYATLVNAIKEQNLMMQELKAEIELLKAK